jgi:hypothetical protein
MFRLNRKPGCHGRLDVDSCRYVTPISQMVTITCDTDRVESSDSVQFTGHSKDRIIRKIVGHQSRGAASSEEAARDLPLLSQ